ncbi:MAG: 30S ribosomal protein S6 [Sandaracinaceae bacterium]|nr:30S ribosomal protein S6 [Sandaracinaceae bacterium]
MSAAKKLAREYELVYIMRPTIGPSEAKKVSDRVVELLDKYGARLTRVDQWGKRRLAYAIQRHTRGQFVYVRYVGFSDVVAEIERNLRNLDEVIRYQTVRLEGLYDLEALEVDPAEIEFHELEAGADDEDDEPSFEERLGMRERPRAEAADAASGEAELGAPGDIEGDDGEGADASGAEEEA